MKNLMAQSFLCWIKNIDESINFKHIMYQDMRFALHCFSFEPEQVKNENELEELNLNSSNDSQTCVFEAQLIISLVNI